ncbi:MAG: hypothetical protein QM768_21815 [Agriterribacter sp.]
MQENFKSIRERERKQKEAEIRAKCEAHAIAKYGEETVIKLSNKHKGLFYLPVFDEEDEIDKMAIFRPIDKEVLNYASTKIESDGLYTFIETCMRECWLEGDQEILDDKDFFLPAANQFNKIIDGKKAALVKR